ncbi:MAG: alpha-mannosidase [Acidimicrobiaceae bacterium]|nr:alpha-mannosidase [Acidimicrobiaceae bacterium]
MEETRETTRLRAKRTLDTLIRPAIYDQHREMQVLALHVGGEPITAAEARVATFEPFAVGSPWGGAWDTSWFRLHETVPEGWQGREVRLRFSLGYTGQPGFGAEAMVWDGDRPVTALNSRHNAYTVLPKATGGEDIDLWVEAAANPVASMGVPPAPMLMPDYGGRPLFRLDRADLATVVPEVESFFYDFAVLLDLYDALPPDEARAANVLRALNDACNRLNPRDIAGTVEDARPPLSDALAQPANASAPKMSAVGNAHIDTAWLWPLRETARKAARTFSTAVDLMDEYPDYHYACSQPAQMAMVERDYPELFERIKEKVAAGQFEPVGAMWVEPDCNVPSGESLVRQTLYGFRYWQEKFGVEVTEVWLPDVFGYAASLPQIMRLAGLDRFLTQKLSWNRLNRMPHHTFWWEGIDGSRVFTHFPPADTYGATMSMAELGHAAKNFRDHGRSSHQLYLYGYGDGGGGPTRGMLERAHRLRDLEGAPRVTLETAADFWDQATAEAHDLATWAGELYFEYHRGTYTTQAEGKRNNRQLELLLREAELWSRRDLTDAWKDLLVLQFHDILPGTSIHWVYEDARRTYAAIRQAAEVAAAEGAAALAERADTSAAAQPLVVFNSSPFARREVVEERLVELPPLGYTVVDMAVAAKAPENDILLGLEWDDRGLLTSIWDHEAGREVLAGPANLFQLHEDRPVQWDAWDIDGQYLEQVTDLTDLDEFEVGDGVVRIVRSFGSSQLRQTIRLRPGSRRIDFETEVDWHEDHRLLKVAFPVDIHARRATYEIQYGHVERPNHRNTSWDVARFEVCAHKWVDLGEPGYGVALLNDCKYGHDIFGNTIRLSLLRAPTSPDPVADRGHHRFTYSLFPHPGDFREAGVIEEAYALNLPVRAVPAGVHSGDLPPTWSAVSVDQPNLVVEAVKTAEDEDATVVRLYEAWGRRGRARVTFGEAVASANIADLLERPLEALTITENGVDLDFRPFQILTLLVHH